MILVTCNDIAKTLTLVWKPSLYCSLIKDDLIAIEVKSASVSANV